MGARGRARVRELFSGEAAETALASLYERVLTARKAAASGHPHGQPAWT